LGAQPADELHPALGEGGVDLKDGMQRAWYELPEKQ
jgi:hypothetical protein